METPVVWVAVAHQGEKLDLMALPQPEYFVDAPEDVRKDLERSNQTHPFYYNEDTIQVIFKEDGTHLTFVTSGRREDLDNTALVKWLIGHARQIAEETGWKFGQKVDNPRLFDNLYRDEDGVGIAQMLYDVEPGTVARW